MGIRDFYFFIFSDKQLEAKQTGRGRLQKGDRPSINFPPSTPSVALSILKEPTEAVNGDESSWSTAIQSKCGTVEAVSIPSLCGAAE